MKIWTVRRNTQNESNSSIQNGRMCHTTTLYEAELNGFDPKLKVQLLKAEFDMKDEDKPWLELCCMVLNTDCESEGETVGSTCACCGSAVVILEVHGEATIQDDDSAEEDDDSDEEEALATLANAWLRCCFCAVEQSLL